MTYAVKYLAGAYHVAGGNPSRAVHYYAAGYYYAAKRKGQLAMADANPIDGFRTVVDGNGAVARKGARRESAARLREARSEGLSVPSSSSLYGGQVDYH